MKNAEEMGVVESSFMVADSFAVRYLAGESLHEVLEGPFREAVKVTPAMCCRFMESFKGSRTNPKERSVLQSANQERQGI